MGELDTRSLDRLFYLHVMSAVQHAVAGTGALCERRDAEPVEFNGEQGNVHPLLKLNPNAAPSVAANNSRP